MTAVRFDTNPIGAMLSKTNSHFIIYNEIIFDYNVLHNMLCGLKMTQI